MKLSIARFCDLVYGWALSGLEKDDRIKLEAEFNAPLNGEARREPTKEEIDADTRAMMALSAQLS